MQGLAQKRLEVVLAEYSNIRTEIRDTFRLHLQLFAITLSAMAVILGYAIAQQAYWVFLIVPAFSIALFYRWLWDQNGVMALSYYQFVEIERKKIPLLVGLIQTSRTEQNSESEAFKWHWMAWQLFYLYHMDRQREKGFPRSHVYPVVGIFLVLPLALSVDYSAIWVFQNINWLNLIIGLTALHIGPNLAYIFLSMYGITSYWLLNRHFLKLYEESGYEIIL